MSHLALGSFPLRQQTGINDLQIVVFGKTDDEMIGKRLDFAQPFIDDDRFYAAKYRWPDIGGVTEMGTASTRTLGPKVRHDAAKALCPVTRPELPAVAGDALDEELAGLLFIRFGHWRSLL